MRLVLIWAVLYLLVCIAIGTLLSAGLGLVGVHLPWFIAAIFVLATDFLVGAMRSV